MVRQPSFRLTLRYIQYVRYVLSGLRPDPTSILLVESWSREIMEKVIEGLRRVWGHTIFIDLVTCYPTLPRGFDPRTTRTYLSSDYRGFKSRRRLMSELAANEYNVVGIVCSGEALLLKWKWALALALKAKVFIVNENGDYFWLDREHLPVIRRFIIERAGLAGAGTGIVRRFARTVAFPFALPYLALYAAVVHARRAVRLLAAGRGGEL